MPRPRSKKPNKPVALKPARPPKKKAHSEPEAGVETLHRLFEGRAALDRLLGEAGALADTEDVAEAFKAALTDQAPVQVVLEALFEDEPRFASPAKARALYGNLFGLWDLLESGVKVDLAAPATLVPRHKKPPVAPPGRFSAEGPSEAWVEDAWRYLDDLPAKEQQKYAHAFDNRHDALVTWLDESGLSDVPFALARHVLFELFAMLELGAGPVAPVEVTALHARNDAGSAVPPALGAWVEEAVFLAEQDEEAPLGAEDAEQVRRLIRTGLFALWSRRSS